MNTLIVGGGIGGLTAALTLSRAGHQVTLAEKMERFTAVGAGIIMGPNAVRLLEALGVDLARSGHALPSIDVVRADGSPLLSMRATDLPREYGPALAFARPELHQTLREALPDEVKLLLSHAVSCVRETDGTVEVHFEGDAAPRWFDLVVGADGLHSTVRDAVMGPRPLRYSGTTCWRGIAENPGFATAVESWGAGTRVGVVPLRDNQVYYYLVRSAPRRAPAPSWPGGFRDVFGEHTGEVAKVFDALTDAPPLHHDLEELHEPVWGRSRVVLLGDAAHAMTPNQGQGAGMAVEDAYALMLALRPGTRGVLARYTALRHRRVRRMQLDSRRIGVLAHLRNPLARAARDGLAPRIPAAVMYRRLVVEPALALLRAEGQAARTR